MHENWAWIDLETTGLESEKDRVLEAALIVTTPDLEVLFERACLVRQDDLEAVFAATPDRVQQMHLANGLWEDLSGGVGTALAEVESLLFAEITRHGAQRGPLCGFNPAFDRGFLKVHMPRVVRALHYRSFDLNSFRIAGTSWGAFEFPAQHATTHRALQDCRDGVELARGLRAFLYGRTPKGDEIVPRTWIMPERGPK